jgi:tRNA modification GTPase
LLQLVLRSICEGGVRLAGPGEFTLRAFLSGRIDLTQAEAVLGTIDAHDSRELRIALDQLAGGLAKPLHQLRDHLLDLLAHVEAGLDFADEDLSLITGEELDRRLAKTQNDLDAISRQVTSRGVPADMVRVVLIGRPNAGKSSLFNALAGNQAALVSDHAGTTRDYLTAEIDLDGVKCRLIDTAGLGGKEQGAGNELEIAAESIAAQQRDEAHIEIFCVDATRPFDDVQKNFAGTIGNQQILVLTKCDAAPRNDDTPSTIIDVCLGNDPANQSNCPIFRPSVGRPRPICCTSVIRTSSITGLGVDALRAAMRRCAIEASKHHGDVVACTAARCADSLRRAGLALQHARDAVAAGQDELAADDLRAALLELGNVVGAVYTDDLLDRIFGQFCIGK